MIYDGDLKPVAELDSAGNITTRYVYAAKENVPEYLIRGGITYRIITDQLGSPRLIVDASNGTVVQKMNFDEYGNVTSSYDSLGIPFGFAGGLYDTQTKLVRFGERDYDGMIGRWTTKDPIGFRSKSSNLFSYAGNNPTNLIDPDGKMFGPFGVMASFVGVGVAVNVGMQLVSDVVNHKEPTIEKIFSSAFAGGAAGFMTWTGMNPVLIGAISGGLDELARELAEGNGVSATQVSKAILVGIICGKIPGTSTGYTGTGTLTKLYNGSVGSVSGQTVMSSINYQMKKDAAYESSLLFNMIMGLLE
jgi:RHS repeat-associated protein